MLDWWKSLSLSGRIPIAAMVAVVALAALGAFDGRIETWWAERQATKLAEQQQEQLNAVGTDATIAGGMLYSAWKQCHVIGIEDVDACAKQAGPLLQEQTAATSAGIAAGMRDAYFKTCRAGYANDYCVALIQRSVVISQNSDSNRSAGR